MRAFHTAELQYLFQGFHGARGESHPLGPDQERLAQQMVELWTAFARTGVPTSVTAGRWPNFDATAVPILVFKRGGSVLQGKAAPATAPSNSPPCAFWDPINARH
jgi:para-nitrobenzyl esterase